MDVLELIEKEGENSTIRNDATSRIGYLCLFDFAFGLQLMLKILGITNDLSMALQKQDQNIVNAIKLVQVTTKSLEALRTNGWDNLLDKTCEFCEKHNILAPNMTNKWVLPGRHGAILRNILMSFIIGFYTVVDLYLAEIRSHFSEINTELLSCVACFSPYNRFSAFDQHKLTKLVEFHLDDFSEIDTMTLKHQLANYVLDVESDVAFDYLTGLNDLCRVIIETKKDITYPLVFRLLKLALILPVSTTTVERAFSTMNIVKARLRNRMSDTFLNDCESNEYSESIFIPITSFECHY